MFGITEGDILKMSNGGESYMCVVDMSVHDCHVSLLKGCCGELTLRTVWRALYSRLLLQAGLQLCRWQAPLWGALQALDVESDLKFLGSALFFAPCPHWPLFLAELIWLSG